MCVLLLLAHLSGNSCRRCKQMISHAILRYIGWSYIFEKCHVLHETGAAVLVGLVAGYIIQLSFGRTVSFSYDMFSYILLPMVIFSAGFNLDKHRFFRLLSISDKHQPTRGFGGYIFALGITGTALRSNVLKRDRTAIALAHPLLDTFGIACISLLHDHTV